VTTTNGLTKALAALAVTAATTALIVCVPVFAVAQEFSCTITAPRPARAFFPGESIYLTVTVSGPQQQATYTIFDYETLYKWATTSRATWPSPSGCPRAYTISP